MTDAVKPEASTDDAELRELEGAANTLEAEAAPQTQPEDQQQTANDEQQAYVMAGTICALLAKGATMRWPYLQYPDDTIKQGAAVLAPVLVKYDMQSEFLDKWKEEISAAVFFGTLIASSYSTIKAHEAEEKAAKAKPVEGEHANQ